MEKSKNGFDFNLQPTEWLIDSGTLTPVEIANLIDTIEFIPAIYSKMWPPKYYLQALNGDLNFNSNMQNLIESIVGYFKVHLFVLCSDATPPIIDLDVNGDYAGSFNMTKIGSGSYEFTQMFNTETNTIYTLTLNPNLWTYAKLIIEILDN